MTEDMSVYGDSQRPVLPTWPYVVAFLMFTLAVTLMRLGDNGAFRLGTALILVCSFHCWGMGFFWLREKFRRSSLWDRRPIRFWLRVAPAMFLMILWPTLLLAVLMGDVQRCAS